MIKIVEKIKVNILKIDINNMSLIEAKALALIKWHLHVNKENSKYHNNESIYYYLNSIMFKCGYCHLFNRPNKRIRDEKTNLYHFCKGCPINIDNITSTSVKSVGCYSDNHPFKKLMEDKDNIYYKKKVLNLIKFIKVKDL